MGENSVQPRAQSVERGGKESKHAKAPECADGTAMPSPTGRESRARVDTASWLRKNEKKKKKKVRTPYPGLRSPADIARGLHRGPPFWCWLLRTVLAPIDIPGTSRNKISFGRDFLRSARPQRSVDISPLVVLFTDIKAGPE